MVRSRKQERNGPGLLFLLVALVVVAVVGARYFGFYPDSGDAVPVPRSEQTQDSPQAPQGQTKPSILVYHSHATENYSPKDSHRRGGEPGDVVTVGSAFVQRLQDQGVMVIHDLTVHDKPRYSDAFIHSATMVENALTENADIKMVLDIHRDGLQDKPEGFTTVTINGVELAKILFVIGDKDNGKLEQNLAFAKQISDALDKAYPGVSRGVRVFQSDYSGQLHPNSVMAVIGDWHGNTLEQASASAHVLADVVVPFLTGR